MRRRSLVLLLAAAAVATACARNQSSGFPPPVRPGIISPTPAGSTFRNLSALMEARGFPVLMADTSFGVLRTDWVEWEPGEVSIADMADCDVGADAPVARTRARFSFEVRPRANRSFVTIMSQWQMEKHGGFDSSDAGFVDCPSTGEWERMLEESILQRQVIGQLR